MTTLLALVLDGWRAGKAKDHARDDEAVLTVLREQGLAGAVDVMRATGWSSGRTYLVLARLEGSRRVRTSRVMGRRMYWIPEDGR